MKLPPFGKPLPAADKRLILGAPSQQLFPLAYPWMWDAYLAAQANHWTPLDIQMHQDRYDYKHKLTDEERWMFDWCLSMLTTQDLVVMGNLEEAIERHLTCPEASMYLSRQTDEEGIHTWSYQYIVESLDLDQNTVYQRFLREESLYAKVKMAYEFHRKLLELRMDDHQSVDAIAQFIECVAFWAFVMEGGWFYVGFIWVYALRRRSLMPGATEMFQYIQRDESNHMTFWIQVINTLIAEYPESYNAETQANIVTLIREGHHLEEQYARDVCHNVVGISADSYMAHYRNRMNLSAAWIGIDEIWAPQHARPLDWATEFEILKEKNFFETRVTEYQKGGLSDWGNNEPPVSVID